MGARGQDALKPYTLSAFAQQDISEIRTYVAERNPDAAVRLVRRFREVFRGIAEHPHATMIHPDFSELFGEPVRARYSGPYVILYRSNLDPPQIFAVLHGARGLVRVLQRRFF